MDKVLNKIIQALGIVCLGLIFILRMLNEGLSFDGITILLIMIITLIRPIVNLYSIKIKTIKNSFYLFLILGILLFTVTISAISLYLFYQSGFNVNDNAYLIFFLDYLLYIFIALILSYIISFFCKKDIYKRNIDNTRTLYLVVFIICLILGLTYSSTLLGQFINLLLSFFYLMAFIKYSQINTKANLQKIYFVTLVMTLLSCNFLAAVFIIQLYINLDTFGLNL